MIACLLAAGSLLSAEDMQLRSRAVTLLDRASMVSRFQGDPYNVRTEVSFTASGPDGSLESGSYIRNRATDAALREDLTFGNYSASSIKVGSSVGSTPGWEDPPFATRRVRGLVPFGAGSFDSSDVIEQIKDSSYSGRPATCIEFETIVGEQRLPGEICLDKANGTLLELRTGSKLSEYSGFDAVKGGLFPTEMAYRDGAFSLNASLKMTVLEERPDDLLAIPADWKQGTFCKQFQFPVAKVAPQPRGEGAPDAPVTDVAVHLHVSATGAVSSAEVLRPVRPDLDAEALKLAGKWVFEPGTCEGRAQEYVIDEVLHFQGWRVKDSRP